MPIHAKKTQHNEELCRHSLPSNGFLAALHNPLPLHDDLGVLFVRPLFLTKHGQRAGHPLYHVELAYAATKERWYLWCELWARRQRSQTLEPTQGSRLNSRWFERTNLHDPLEFIFLALPFRNSFSSLLGSPNFFPWFVILWDGFATDVLLIALQMHPSM